MTTPKKPKPRATTKRKRATKAPVVRRAVATKHNWEMIRAYYVESEAVPSPTLKDISDIHNVNYDTLRDRAAKERWTTLRATFQFELAQQRQQERISTLAKEAIAFDDTSLRAAKLGQTLIAGRLGQIGALFSAGNHLHQRTLQKIQQGEPVTLEELRSAINYKELDALSRSLVTFQDVGRKALGTDVDKLEISGPEGVPMEVNITHELQKPDQDRIASILDVIQRAGIANIVPAITGEEEEVGEDDEVEDAEIVD